jgi:hypothetical protein
MVAGTGGHTMARTLPDRIPKEIADEPTLARLRPKEA